MSTQPVPGCTTRRLVEQGKLEVLDVDELVLGVVAPSRDLQDPLRDVR